MTNNPADTLKLEEHTNRWNFHKTADGFQVCFGEHEKGTGCRYETFVHAPSEKPTGDDKTVKIPQCVDEARLMALLGVNYLEQSEKLNLIRSCIAHPAPVTDEK